MAATVGLERPADGVALLLLDNPPKNFGSYELLQALHDRLVEARESGSRVVVLASDVPGYLMAHAWLPDVIAAYESPGDVTGDTRLWRAVTNELERGPMVSISCNEGQAWGGGAEISWACDLRTASRSATYAQIEAILGVIPGGGGTVRLSRLAGQSKAMEIFLSAEPVGAPELAELGIVNRVYDDADAREKTLEWAELIATRPARALRACKRGIRQTWDLPYEAAERLENHLFNSTIRPKTLEILKEIQARYDEGMDSWDAYGLDRH